MSGFKFFPEILCGVMSGLKFLPEILCDVMSGYKFLPEFETSTSIDQDMFEPKLIEIRK